MAPMDIESIEAAANDRLFDRLGVDAKVTMPGDLSRTRRVVIDRDAKLLDERGVVLESRCEVGLKISDVGTSGLRGTIVDVGAVSGAADDAWKLMKPLGNDGNETLWEASKHRE